MQPAPNAGSPSFPSALTVIHPPSLLADLAVVTALLSATGVLAAERVQLPLEVTPVGESDEHGLQLSHG